MRMDSMKKRRSTASTKMMVLAISIILLLSVAVMGTMMFLVSKTPAVTNTFDPAHVSCAVQENFDGTVKKNVNVTNTSDIDAYLRVKLVTYRVNADGERIGGTATIPEFTPGSGWFEKDGFYYYNKPVAPGAVPDVKLIGDSGINLMSYTDADGGKQVIEVVAEAIQAKPTSVVADKWNVTVNDNGTISKKN